MDEFGRFMELATKALAENPVPRLMSLRICNDSNAVEFWLDNTRSSYSDCIEGCGGADCGVMRDMVTKEIIGIRLPLRFYRLIVDVNGRCVTFNEPTAHVNCESCGIAVPHKVVSPRLGQCEFCGTERRLEGGE